MKLDFRLIDIEFELFQLEEQIGLIKEQFPSNKKREELFFRKKCREEKLTPDDPDWHFHYDKYIEKVDFLLPRFYYYPLIISMYAVFESSIIDISNHIRKKIRQKLSINDLRGSFLQKSKKFFDNILNFDLYNSEESWQQVHELSHVRHAVAHTNGRLEMMRKKNRERIVRLTNKDAGISIQNGFVIPAEKLISRSFLGVNDILRGLIDRYKQWDDSH